MEQRYKSLDIFEFSRRFPDEQACMEYLVKQKWGSGYSCPKCRHERYCQGKREYERQCTRCGNTSSPTSGTLFHKVKFPLLKAFYIVYYVSTGKKGIASTELSRKLSLRQKTCWLFKQKVMKAMESGGEQLIVGSAEVDETVVGGQEEGVVGRKNAKKKIVAFAIERHKKGVSRIFGKVISKADSKELGIFMRSVIDVKAKVKTDQWTGYMPLKADYEHLKQVPSGRKGKNFPEMHRVIMQFKGWLRGIHHHAEHLQAYVNEYTYRYNRSNQKV